ncbi:MAG: CrcB family protein [Actinobacteria bacterium]|nr:CrcB family protein [Actinomycetota bacterium]NDH13223.1 CrcB family protein [Actinomycetota bacterium]
MLIDLLTVSLGGIIGSVTRWQVIEIVGSSLIGVFIVNILGVLVAGVAAYRMKATEAKQLFWITGFAGGFTTFSSLALISTEESIVTSSIYVTAMLVISMLVLTVLRPKAKK